MGTAANRPLTIGVDIGATKIAGGLLNAKGKLTKSIFLPTLADRGQGASLAQVFRVMERLIRFAGGRENLRGIGICAPGPLNLKTGTVRNPPNLRWRIVPLARLVRQRFGLPCLLENDANAAGLAEVLIGAAADYRDVFYVTVSTGVGASIIIDKKIYHGKNGLAGHGGHVPIDYHSPYVCGCGTHGCIEALASGPSMARRARVLLESEHSTPSLLRTLSRGDLNRITPAIIAAAARRRDRIAKSILDETGFLLGVWLGGMISLLDPEAVVIGGGVSHIGKPLFDKIRETVPHYTVLRDRVATLPILPAKLRKNVGVYGAASLFLNLA
ncbi:MAG TPA: ROK family protein [Acidobacteriota bacterium]|nr:ROK family protein [Acidobacteriota bacterium]